MPLRRDELLRGTNIDLRLRATVTEIDHGRARSTLEVASRLAYDALLLATGAEPVRGDPGRGRRTYVLRRSRQPAIIERGETARAPS